jgi:hypothetical protein
MTTDGRGWSLREALAAVEAQDGFDAAQTLEAWQVLIDTGAVELLGCWAEVEARRLILAGLCTPGPEPRVALPSSFWDLQLLAQVRRKHAGRRWGRGGRR